MNGVHRQMQFVSPGCRRSCCLVAEEIHPPPWSSTFWTGECQGGKEGRGRCDIRHAPSSWTGDQWMIMNDYNEVLSSTAAEFTN